MIAAATRTRGDRGARSGPTGTSRAVPDWRTPLFHTVSVKDCRGQEPNVQKVLPPLALNHDLDWVLSRKTTINAGMTKPSR